MLAADAEDRERSARPKACQQPSNEQNEVCLVLHVQERAQIGNGVAGDRLDEIRDLSGLVAGCIINGLQPPDVGGGFPVLANGIDPLLRQAGIGIRLDIAVDCRRVAVSGESLDTERRVDERVRRREGAVLRAGDDRALGD